MMLVTTTTKTKLAGRVARTVAKHPGATWTGVRRSVPAARVAFGVGRLIATRRARRRMQPLGATARFAAGVAIGAGTVYFFDSKRSL